MNFLETQDKKYDEEVLVPDAQYLYPKDSSQKPAHVMRAADPNFSPCANSEAPVTSPIPSMTTKISMVRNTIASELRVEILSDL